jgi:hypothetical protein
MEPNQTSEPWLRGTLIDIPVVPRAVFHALELAQEDLDRWCRSLSDAELNTRPVGLAPIAFHVRHIARSLDRLLTYAEGDQLNGEQICKDEIGIRRSSKARRVIRRIEGSTP